MKSIIAGTTATKRFGKLLWAVLILQHHSYHSTTHAAAPESFCGTNWADAEKNCFEPCPSGDDSDCTTDGHKCYGYTGCSVATDNGAEEEEEEELEDPYRNNMCGANWIEAMLTCSTPCGTTSCPSGQYCFAATGCDTPLAPIVSNMIMSLLGDNFPSLRLGNIEQGVFSEGVLEFLAQRMEEERVSINRANVVGQSYIGNNGRRRGRQRMLQWNDTITGSTRTIELSLEQQQKPGRRHLPTSSSAIDVSMTITGEYRPPPYKDMDLIIEESINGAARTLVQDFRTRGRNRGTQFFESVNALEAVSVADATRRPTVSPTTMKPTSLAPTLEPSDSPTRSPSSSPTRAFDQMVQTGYDTDLYIDTARSFGIIFEIKTKPDAETLMIKGLSFYTASAGRVSYEVYSKEGSWVGHEGQLEIFDKVAEGRIRSRGSCDAETAANCDSYFANIPFEKFTQAAVRGGGGSRSFYITLSTNDIMYQRSSYSGESGFQLQAETQDIEIYDGAGVTVYPFSEATEDRHFIKPRGFLGRIWYERNPCEDGSMEWPCTTRAPISPTTPPTPDPTEMPISQEPMKEGTTQQPTIKPTTTQPTPPAPVTPAPVTPAQDLTETVDIQNVTAVVKQPTLRPSPKPVIEYSYVEGDVTSTNIVVTLHNVLNKPMDLRETRKYCDLLIDFIHSQPSVRGSMVNVLNATVWHQAAAVDDTKQKQGYREKKPTVGSVSRKRGKARKRRALEEESSGMIEDDTGGEQAAPEWMVSMDVTTIFEMTNALLPSPVAEVLLLHVIEENTAALIDLFHAEKNFYTFFSTISDISGRIIEEVTHPPSSAPTTQSQMLAALNADSIQDEEEDVNKKKNLYIVVGLFAAILWIMLTCYSMYHLHKSRSKMKNENMLRQVSLKQRKQDNKLTEENLGPMFVFQDIGDNNSGNLSSTVSMERGGTNEEEEGSSIMDRDDNPAQPTTLFDDFFLSDISEKKSVTSKSSKGDSSRSRKPSKEKKDQSTNQEEKMEAGEDTTSARNLAVVEEDPLEAEEKEIETLITLGTTSTRGYGTSPLQQSGTSAKKKNDMRQPDAGAPFKSSMSKPRKNRNASDDSAKSETNSHDHTSSNRQSKGTREFLRENDFSGSVADAKEAVNNRPAQEPLSKSSAKSVTRRGKPDSTQKARKPKSRRTTRDRGAVSQSHVAHSNRSEEDLFTRDISASVVRKKSGGTSVSRSYVAHSNRSEEDLFTRDLSASVVRKKSGGTSVSRSYVAHSNRSEEDLFTRDLSASVVRKKSGGTSVSRSYVAHSNRSEEDLVTRDLSASVVRKKSGGTSNNRRAKPGRSASENMEMFFT